MDSDYIHLMELENVFAGALISNALKYARIPITDSRAQTAENSLVNKTLDIVFSTETEKVPLDAGYFLGSIGIYAILDAEKKVTCCESRGKISQILKSKKIRKVDAAQIITRVESKMPVYKII